jgi:hypothetical protein
VRSCTVSRFPRFQSTPRPMRFSRGMCLQCGNAMRRLLLIRGLRGRPGSTSCDRRGRHGQTPSNPCQDDAGRCYTGGNRPTGRPVYPNQSDHNTYLDREGCCMTSATSAPGSPRPPSHSPPVFSRLRGAPRCRRINSGPGSPTGRACLRCTRENRARTWQSRGLHISP